MINLLLRDYHMLNRLNDKLIKLVRFSLEKSKLTSIYLLVKMAAKLLINN